MNPGTLNSKGEDTSSVAEGSEAKEVKSLQHPSESGQEESQIFLNRGIRKKSNGRASNRFLTFCFISSLIFLKIRVGGYSICSFQLLNYCCWLFDRFIRQQRRWLVSALVLLFGGFLKIVTYSIKSLLASGCDGLSIYICQLQYLQFWTPFLEPISGLVSIYTQYM